MRPHPIHIPGFLGMGCDAPREHDIANSDKMDFLRLGRVIHYGLPFRIGRSKIAAIHPSEGDDTDEKSCEHQADSEKEFYVQFFWHFVFGKVRCLDRGVQGMISLYVRYEKFFWSHNRDAAFRKVFGISGDDNV